MNSTPTIHDVAELASVSIKSVSRVINNEPHVSAKLRSKVEGAIAQLGYIPDLAARSLAGSRNFTIGLLLDNPSPHYTLTVQAGIYRACDKHRHHLRINRLESTADESDLANQLAELVHGGRVDGFVLTPPITDNLQVLDFLDQQGIPYSRLAPFVEPSRSAGARIDDRAAAAGVAELFWSLGHRRFGIVTGPERHGAALARRAGFLDRLRQFDPQVVVSEAYGGFDFLQGIEAGQSLVEQADRPTAIFATNDASAAGVMVAIARQNLSIPAEISICGFDDSWVATSVWPLLTTIRQPIEEMAYAAACRLIVGGGRKDEAVLETLGFEMITRSSVGPSP